MSDDERWETVAWDLLDLTRMFLPLGDGPNAGWTADLETSLTRIEPGHSGEEHIDAVGRRLAEATTGSEVVPKRYVGLAWWIYAELRDVPADAHGHDRAMALAERWRGHLEQAFGTVSITG